MFWDGQNITELDGQNVEESTFTLNMVSDEWGFALLDGDDRSAEFTLEIQEITWLSSEDLTNGT